MVILKFAKNENKFFNALSMGLANAGAYDVYIDKKVVATLQPGQETEINLTPGSHIVFFKLATLMGQRSNKITVNIEGNKDYIIQGQNGGSGVVVSSTLLQHSSSVEYLNVKCDGCGATNKIIKGRNNACEYCGAPLEKTSVVNQDVVAKENDRYIDNNPTLADAVDTAKKVFKNFITNSLK